MKDGLFKVEAAGNIQVGPSANSVTGQTAGFHIGVSWSEIPFIGGVMSRKEAKRLADFINDKLSNCEDTEKEAVAKAYQQIR